MILKRVKQDRLWLHAHPEIAYQEFKTADYVRTRLKELNIPFVDGIAGTGVVAEIKGQGESNYAIGLRADMDALPMKEENTFAHRSKMDNGMHGCGHDGHMAILIGVAEVLSKENDFDGVVYLIFQPAEEGHAGARRMIKEGLFERFPMKHIFALHNWPDLNEGEIGSLKGPIMASSHYMSIKINGRGGHGAMPHQATPQMTIAAHIQLGLNSYIAQQTSALHAAVLSLTKITAGTAVAVLPETVLMEGACRLLDSHTTEAFYRDVPPLVQGIASAFGAKAEVDLHEVYPATINDSTSTEIVRRAAINLGLPQADENTGLSPSMASEDFSFMLQNCPGSYFWLGQGAGKDGRALHQPTYDFNDKTIGTGVALFTEIVKTALPLGSIIKTNESRLLG
jgi:hippurate hydrolase